MSTRELIALFNSSSSSRMELVKAGELLYQQPEPLTEMVILMVRSYVGGQHDSSTSYSKSLSWFGSAYCRSVLARRQSDSYESNQNSSSSFRCFKRSRVFCPNLQFDGSTSPRSGRWAVRDNHSHTFRCLWTWWGYAVLFAVQSAKQTIPLHRSWDALRFEIPIP